MLAMNATGGLREPSPDQVSSLLFLVTDPQRVAEHLKQVAAATEHHQKVRADAEAATVKAAQDVEDAATRQTAVAEKEERLNSLDKEQQRTAAALEDRAQRLDEKEKKLAQEIEVANAEMKGREETLAMRVQNHEQAAQERDAEYTNRVRALESMKASLEAQKDEIKRMSAELEAKINILKSAAQAAAA